MSLSTLALKAIMRMMAATESTTIPLSKLSRLPRTLSCLGMYLSLDMTEISMGNPEYAVLAARIRMTNVVIVI